MATTAAVNQRSVVSNDNGTATHLYQQPQLSAEDNATLQSLEEAKSSLFASYMWVVFLVGFPGNVACVLTVRGMTKLSTSTIYVGFLAVVDALTLVVKLLFHQLGYYGVTMGDVGCKTSVLSMVLNCYANWVLVLVCFERFLSVCWPLKKAAIFTKTRAWLCAAVLLLVVCLAYSHLFYFYVGNPQGGPLCGFNTDNALYLQVWYWAASVLFSFAPFALIVVFTLRIIIGLSRYRSARKSILAGEHHHLTPNGKNCKADSRASKRGDHSNVERAISVMMAVAATVFLILSLPTCIYHVAYDPYFAYPPLAKARWDLFQQVTYLLSDVNHAINFYLYFLSAGKFRKHFKALLFCQRTGPRKKSDAASITDNTQYTRASSSENLAMTRV